MIEISKDHKIKFQNNTHEAFVREMIEHLQHADPFHSDTIGVQGLREVIQLGQSNAAHYGFTRKDPVRLYLQLAMYLGSYFDSDPALTWAHRGLTMQEDVLTTQADRANVLRQDFIAYLRMVAGPHGTPVKNFLKSCQSHINDGITTDIALPDVVTFIVANYPEKVEFIGHQSLEALVSQSDAVTNQAGFLANSSTMILACLRMVYGHGVHSDPLFPWVRDVFARAGTSEDPDAMLIRTTQVFLRKVIAHIQSGQKGGA